MGELLYGVHSAVIAVALTVSMAIATEFGLRVGLGRQATASPARKEHVNSIQAAALGILALLLGFTFSLALQRFDQRSEAVVDEANAIGTAYQRAQLLPLAQRADARAALRDYVDLRVAAGTLTLADRPALDRLLAQASQAQGELWTRARRALETDPAAYTPILFIESVNALADSFAKRNAALDRHVPEVVLLLLYATFLMASGIVGYACGLAGHRPSVANHLMVLLMVVLVFLILDLDRPRRGLIQVSEQSLVALQASMQADRARGDPVALPATRP